MQAKATSPQIGNIATWLLVLGAVCLGVVLLLSFAVDGHTQKTAPPASVASKTGVAYFVYGTSADTLWRNPAEDLSKPVRLLTVPHAAEYGVVPSLAPDGKRFVFTALPPNTAAPGRDTPATLWLASADSTKAPVQVATGVDLLVKPLWTPDGSDVVVRRSTSDAYSLVLQPVAGGDSKQLVSSNTQALFPAGFSADGKTLYFVALDQTAGSILRSVNLATNAQQDVAKLSAGLTRDWALSPAHDRLAYLEVALGGDASESRAFMLDLASGAVTPITDQNLAAFGPVWSSDGRLAIGVLDEAAGKGNIEVWQDGKTTQIAGPQRGFDVPLSFTTDGFVVRAFDGTSAAAPGRASLVVVGADGTRQNIANGEVTYLGWTNP